MPYLNMFKHFIGLELNKQFTEISTNGYKQENKNEEKNNIYRK